MSTYRILSSLYRFMLGSDSVPERTTEEMYSPKQPALLTFRKVITLKINAFLRISSFFKRKESSSESEDVLDWRPFMICAELDRKMCCVLSDGVWLRDFTNFWHFCLTLLRFFDTNCRYFLSTPFKAKSMDEFVVPCPDSKLV